MKNKGVLGELGARKENFLTSADKHAWEVENEQTIREMIKKIITECENKGYKQTKEDFSEWMAFGFLPNDQTGGLTMALIVLTYYSHTPNGIPRRKLIKRFLSIGQRELKSVKPQFCHHAMPI